MKKKFIVGFISGIFLFGVIVTAHANMINLNTSSPQTIAGQNFTFNFSPIPLSNGTDGIFSIHARGDYDPGTSTEFLTWDIDSLGIGGTAGPTIGGTTIIQNNGINDVEWSQNFSISGSNLLTITSDSLASIFLDLNGNQTAGVGIGFQPNEFVEVSLSYSAVPEPATMLLLGTGLVGVAGAARRKKKNQA